MRRGKKQGGTTTEKCVNSTSLLARFSIRECACTVDKTVYWGLCIVETSMVSRDGGDTKSSKSRGVGGWGAAGVCVPGDRGGLHVRKIYLNSPGN